MSKSKTLYKFKRHPYPPHIWFAANREGWAKAMAKLGVNSTYPVYAASVSLFESDAGADVYVISMGDACEAQSAAQVIGLMVHELAHVGQRLRRSIGEKNFSDEAESYLLQAMFLWLHAAYTDAGRGFTE